MNSKLQRKTREYVLRDFERERTGNFYKNPYPLPKFSDKEALEEWRKRREKSEKIRKHWEELSNNIHRKKRLNGGSIPVPGKERMIQFEEEYRKRHLIPKRLEEIRKRQGRMRRLSGGRGRESNERGARRSPTPPTPTLSQLDSDMDDDDDDDEDYYNDGDFRLGRDVPFYDEAGFWGELEVEDELENGNYSEEEKARLWNEYFTNVDTWEAIRMSKNDTGEVTEFGRAINSAISEFESNEDILHEYIDTILDDEAPIYKIYNALEIRKYYGTDPVYYHTFETNVEDVLRQLHLQVAQPRFISVRAFDLGESLRIICANEIHYQLMRNGVNHRACKIILDHVLVSTDPIQRELFNYYQLKYFVFVTTHRNRVALDGIIQIINNIRQRFQAVVANSHNRQYILPYNIH